MAYCNICKQQSGLLVKACNCSRPHVHLECAASKSLCNNCNLNYPQDIKNIIKSTRFELKSRINILGGMPSELRDCVIMLFEKEILKQEKKKRKARLSLQENIIKTITKDKLYANFDSIRTRKFTKEYISGKFKLSECLL